MKSLQGLFLGSVTGIHCLDSCLTGASEATSGKYVAAMMSMAVLLGRIKTGGNIGKRTRGIRVAISQSRVEVSTATRKADESLLSDYGCNVKAQG